MPTTLARTLVLALCAFTAAAAAAQPYPTRPIRLVVPFPAGGTADLVARAIAEPLSQSLGQPVVLDNKPGADGAIAGDVVRKSSPDGYTLFFATNTPLNAAPTLRKTPPYDPVADFTPISLLGAFATFLVVSNDVPARNLQELVAYARANPGKVSYATGNTQSILASAQLKRAQGIDIVHVPYKGDVQALPDLSTNRVQMMFATGVVVPHVKEGKMRAIAAMMPARSPLLPDVPTMDEAGAASVTIGGWAGLFGPAELPADVVSRLNAAVAAVLAKPEVRDTLDKLAFSSRSSSPQEAAAFLATQLAAWRRTIDGVGIERD